MDYYKQYELSCFYSKEFDKLVYCDSVKGKSAVFSFYNNGFRHEFKRAAEYIDTLKAETIERLKRIETEKALLSLSAKYF